MMARGVKIAGFSDGFLILSDFREILAKLLCGSCQPCFVKYLKIYMYSTEKMKRIICNRNKDANIHKSLAQQHRVDVK